MNYVGFRLALVLLVSGFTCNRGVAEEPTVASKKLRDTRLLLVTQSAGFKHGAVTRTSGQLSPAERVMTELGVSSNLFRVDCTQDVVVDFTPERLDAYSIVMFYTSGELPIPPETREYFLQHWLRQPGHGFIGVHAATDTLHQYEPYWDMIGGTFNGHPWTQNQQVAITVHDTQHPASRPWGESFTITDEIYQFKNWRPENVRVLMSLDMAKTSLKKRYHVPIAWVKEYGDGKVFYLSLGHREDVWANPTYQQSLLGGIQWILGVAPGDATPNPEVSAQQQRQAELDAAETES